MLRTTLLTLVALGLAAQTPAPKAEAKPAQAPAPVAAPAAKPAPAAAPVAKPEPPKEDKVIARIDGVAIQESEMDLMYANLNPQQKQSMAGQDRAKAINSYLEFRLLVAKAKRLGLDKSPAYEKKLKLNGYQLLASEFLQKETEALQKKTAVSDDEVKAYFEANKDAFKAPGKFNARHILVKTKGGANGEQGLSEEEAVKKMAEIKAEFDKGGKWEELAKKYSEDPGSKDKGGLYEGIAFGQFVPEFEAAVKKQDIGKVGEPVKSSFGFHLIQVETRGDSEVPAFEGVKDQAKQKAAQAKQEKVWKDFIDTIRKEVPITEGAEAAKAAPAAKPAVKPAKPAVKKAETAK
jgi:peptidyl-prolyl cis-trans isomerase C